MTPLEMLQLPTVLHVLPTFDTGGLGSLALTMIDSWPEKARHIAIAPKYVKTKPDLFMPFAKLIGQQNVMQIDRHVWEQAPVWIERLAGGITKLLRARPLNNAIAYNFIDAGYSAQAIRRVGFGGQVAAHVGTVLPDNETTRCIARAKLNLTFVPASAAVDGALRKLFTDSEAATQTTRVHSVVWNGVNLATYMRPARCFIEQALGGGKFVCDNPVTTANGFCTEHGAQDARTFHARVAEPRPSIVFGFSGRMANPPVKDWDTLIEGFRLAAIPGAQLRIAGDGPPLSQLKAKAQGLDVVFTGQLSPEVMIDFLHGINVFVMAALPFEGFSMALVEAVAAGCMVIGTDAPSVVEVLGRNGFTTHSAEGMGHLMRCFRNEGNMHERDNLQLMNTLRPLLDAKRMARSYWEIK